MNNAFTNDFVKIYRAEWLKTRKNLAFWITLLFPFFCTLMVSIKFIGDNRTPNTPWPDFILQANNVISFFLPFFLILTVSFATQIEYKNFGWKQIYAQPVSRISIFFGKYAMILSLTLMSMAIAFFIILGLGLLVHLVRPALSFPVNGFSFETYFRLFAHTFLAGIFTVTLQYWICMRLKGFMAPIVTGVFFTIIPIAYLMILGIAGLLRKGMEVIRVFEYDPYSYPFSTLFHFPNAKPTVPAIVPDMLQLHLGLALLVLIVAAIDIQRRKAFV